MNKYLILIIGIPVILLGFAFHVTPETPDVSSEIIDIPKDVQVALDKSCMPCHSNEVSAFKAKTRLNFDKLNDLSKPKQISKLTKIAEEIEEGKMPKKKFLNKHPESVLTSKEQTLIINWAEQLADQLANKQ